MNRCSCLNANICRSALTELRIGDIIQFWFYNSHKVTFTAFMIYFQPLVWRSQSIDFVSAFSFRRRSDKVIEIGKFWVSLLKLSTLLFRCFLRSFWTLDKRTGNTLKGCLLRGMKVRNVLLSNGYVQFCL